MEKLDWLALFAIVGIVLLVLTSIQCEVRIHIHDKPNAETQERQP